MRVAFLGLGQMGAPMARTLLKAGHPLRVWNRDAAKAEGLRAKGAQPCATIREAVAGAEVAISMLADDAALRAVTEGPESLIAHLAPKAIHVAMGTHGVAASHQLADLHRAAGQGYVAAPVFGRPPAAEAAQLWIVAGGEPAQVEQVLPLLTALGRGLTRVGARPESAHALKLAGNGLLITLVEALGEAFALAGAHGVSAELTLEALAALTRSPLVEGYGGMIAKGAFEPAGFPLRLGLKDMNLALAAAEAGGRDLAVAALVQSRLEEAVAEGFGDQDLAALSRLLIPAQV